MVSFYLSSDNMPLSQFSEGREGKLVSPPLDLYNGVSSASECAKKCLQFTLCTSFNYDYSDSRTCELLIVIQDFDVSLSVVSCYVTWNHF